MCILCQVYMLQVSPPILGSFHSFNGIFCGNKFLILIVQFINFLLFCGFIKKYMPTPGYEDPSCFALMALLL